MKTVLITMFIVVIDCWKEEREVRRHGEREGVREGRKKQSMEKHSSSDKAILYNEVQFYPT